MVLQSVKWLVGWMVGRSVAWLSICLVDSVFGLPVGSYTVLLCGYFVGWLVDCLLACLAKWWVSGLVRLFVGPFVVLLLGS